MASPNQNSLPDHLRNEMARLNRAGFSLLPLGGGPDGKQPRARRWADRKLPLAQVFAPMHKSSCAMYGIRLHGMVVIDCDNDDPALVAEMEKRFGPSPVHLRTPRGRHLYYQVNGDLPDLRAEDLPVDIKSGATAYVAGPFACRPDGRIYEPVKGILGVNGLPLIESPKPRPVALMVTPATIPKGQRHDAIKARAMQCVRTVASEAELARDLRTFRDQRCDLAESVPDSEVDDLANWAWTLRTENRLYSGRDSAFPLDRRALDLLRGKPEQEAAIGLYTRLQDNHGHQPGKTFPLCHAAMKREGLTSLSKARFLAARRLLEQVGLLRLASKHLAGAKMQTFVLTMPQPVQAPATLHPIAPSP